MQENFNGRTLESLDLVAQWLGCPLKTPLLKQITGFAIDSREVKPGFLFFALRGDRFDGHDFLQEVGKRGGIAAVVERTYQGETGGLILLPVDNVIAALQKLATEVQKRRSQTIIAITGSVGKTTTKEFLYTLLSTKLSVTKTPGNSNSQAGLPLAILQDKGEAEVFIVEMGMSEMGHIRTLVDIIPPDISVITKVGYSHVDTVPGGLMGVAQAKSEILSHPRTKRAVIESGAFTYEVIQKTGLCQKYTYALSPEVGDMVLEPGWYLKLGEDESPSFRQPFPETHFCENFTGAALVAKLMGFSWEDILVGVKALKPAQLRFEKIDRDGITIINDCYNASPESTHAALSNLPKPAFGAKTIFVFGEIMTLGKFSEEGHLKIGEHAATKIDHLLCYGKRCLPIVEFFSKVGKPADFFHDLASLKEALFELAKPGDVVLIKGSNGNQLWKLLI